MTADMIGAYTAAAIAIIGAITTAVVTIRGNKAVKARVAALEDKASGNTK